MSNNVGAINDSRINVRNARVATGLSYGQPTPRGACVVIQPSKIVDGC